MPGFPLPVSAPFSLCERLSSLAAISAALSPHPKIPFLAEGSAADIRILSRGRNLGGVATVVLSGRALLLRLQPESFELPPPFRGRIAQPLDVDAAR